MTVTRAGLKTRDIPYQLRYTTNLRKILAVHNNASAQYKKEHLATGLAKQTIFSGL
jgi:hypothetical protein